MSDGFYVRIRGRVHGPMAMAKLKSLASRGQLSRIHEISTDGQSWQPAARMPELFSGGSPNAAAAQSVRATQQEPLGEVLSNPATANPGGATDASSKDGFDPWAGGGEEAAGSLAADPNEQWYYAVDGVQQGPISRVQLADLIRAGTLRQQDMVWKGDMENWSEAGNVSLLGPLFQQAQRAAQVAQPESRVAQSQPSEDSAVASGDPHFEAAIMDELVQSRNWIRIAMVCSIILAVLLLLGGAAMLVTGLATSKGESMIAGIGYFIMGCLFVWLGVAMFNASAQIKRAETEGTPGAKIKAVCEVKAAFMALGWISMLAVIGFVIIVMTAAILTASGSPVYFES